MSKAANPAPRPVARAGEPVGTSLKDLKALKQRLDAAARQAAEREAALRHEAATR